MWEGDRSGQQAVEYRPAALPFPPGSPAGIGLGAGASERTVAPGLKYLADQVRTYEGMQEGFRPEQLGWVQQWCKGELFAHRSAPDGVRWQSREEEDRYWNSGWMKVVAMPDGYHWLPCEPPNVAKGMSLSGDPYYIPWVLPDPMEAYPDAQEPGLQWYPRKEMPYDPQPVIVGQGEEDFYPTKRILKKITWYVPDGVEVGLPRLPVKVFGIPPPDVMPKPKREYSDTGGAVDLVGLREDPRFHQHIENERREILKEYKHQAKHTQDRGVECANALT